MRRILFFAVALLLATPLMCISIVPHPVEYDLNPYVRNHYSARYSVVAGKKTLSPLAVWFSAELERETEVLMPVARRGARSVYLGIDRSMGSEDTYYINVSSSQINVYGGGESGVFYGLQTLLQIMRSEPDKQSVGLMVVDDAPRMAERGVAVVSDGQTDIGRLKSLVGIMARYKLNLLYLPQGAVSASDMEELSAYSAALYVRVEIKNSDTVASSEIRLAMPAEDVYAETGRALALGQGAVGVVDIAAEVSEFAIAAFAEAVWSPREVLDWDDFVSRMGR